MLSIWGYSCHNWELLGIWAWLPAFLTAALVSQGSGAAEAAALALSLAALTYVANIAGSIVGGTMADRWGRTQTILLWSCTSLALSFSIGWLMALPLALLVALACLYNFAGIADSSTHSTVLAESVPAHYLGVAYAVRSVIGFGAGVVSPVVFGWALDLAGGGRASGEAYAWGIAWMTLGLGGLLGQLTDRLVAYKVEGRVKLGDSRDGKQPITIDWDVKDPKGKKLGTVSQKNEIPQGSLDGQWGKTADAAAAAAAQGILKLLPGQKSTN